MKQLREIKEIAGMELVVWRKKKNYKQTLMVGHSSKIQMYKGIV